jgi:hypothetical protein
VQWMLDTRAMSDAPHDSGPNSFPSTFPHVQERDDLLADLVQALGGYD